MPAEFQEAIDQNFYEKYNSYASLDDVLIVKKISVELHRQNLQAILTKIDEENLGISLDKFKYTCKQVELLGFNINSEGTKPLI